MSDYCREKVIRVPCDKYGIKDPWNLSEKYPELFNDYGEAGKFKPSITDRDFIDLYLYGSYGEESGDFGKVRTLTESEKSKYEPLFKQIIPDIDMNDVRLVDYCWYNCCEAPDYYNETTDDFYNEV